MPGRALVQVAGYDFPEPSTYDGITSDLVDQGRNAEGRFIGSVIREDVGKVECSWKFITAEEWATILKLFKKSAGGKFVNLVTFYDQTAAGWVTKEMYVSDRKAGIWRRDPDTGEVLGWAGPKLSLIEV